LSKRYTEDGNMVYCIDRGKASQHLDNRISENQLSPLPLINCVYMLEDNPTVIRQAKNAISTFMEGGWGYGQ